MGSLVGFLDYLRKTGVVRYAESAVTRHLCPYETNLADRLLEEAAAGERRMREIGGAQLEAGTAMVHIHGRRPPRTRPRPCGHPSGAPDKVGSKLVGLLRIAWHIRVGGHLRTSTCGGVRGAHDL